MANYLIVLDILVLYIATRWVYRAETEINGELKGETEDSRGEFGERYQDEWKYLLWLLAAGELVGINREPQD